MKIAVLGCGNMASALVEGMNKSSSIKTVCYTPSNTRAVELSEKTGGESVLNISELPECDIYMIACKPQQFDELADKLAKCVKADSLIMSILAGTTTTYISKRLNTSKVIRVMPNTPSLVGEGVNALYFTDDVNKKMKNEVINLFDSFSNVFVFEKEDEIDLITGFSGSGPAYIFEFARIMIEKMTSYGIDPNSASKMIKHTFLGASKLMVESDDSPEALRNKVTSKEGVTYEALKVFEDNNINKIFSDALDAAYKRSKELAR